VAACNTKVAHGVATGKPGVAATQQLVHWVSRPFAPSRPSSGDDRLSPFAATVAASPFSARQWRESLQQPAGCRGSLNPPGCVAPYTSVGSEISRAVATSTKVLGTPSSSSARPRSARPSCGGGLIWNRNQTTVGSLARLDHRHPHRPGRADGRGADPALGLRHGGKPAAAGPWRAACLEPRSSRCPLGTCRSVGGRQGPVGHVLKPDGDHLGGERPVVARRIGLGRPLSKASTPPAPPRRPGR
jgi:hypothetical protein